MNYYDYIRSDKWKRKADAAKKRAGYRCQVCNASNKTLDAHHRTYERLGHERNDDITVLCRDCHGLYEKQRKLNKPVGILEPIGPVGFKPRKPDAFVTEREPLPQLVKRPTGIKMVILKVRQTDDIDRDERRWRRVSGLLRSHPGTQKFVIEPPRALPPTKESAELVAGTFNFTAPLHLQLMELLGQDAVEVKW